VLRRTNTSKNDTVKPHMACGGTVVCILLQLFCMSVFTDALQRLAIDLALGIQMEPCRNKLVE
jgi:hypothetical protein